MNTGNLDRAMGELFGEAPFELTALGLYFHRDKPPASLRAVEALLVRDAPVRVMDFNNDASLLNENVVPGDQADPAEYEGVGGSGAHRVFRVDHHYDVPSLAHTTTTCLTLRWLRGLWNCGAREVLRAVARSRYVANHADTDILLANHLAGVADERDVIFGAGADWFAAASLRNDHIETRGLGPEAQRVFYACLGIEDEILTGTLSFEEAQRSYLPQLCSWIAGDGRVDVAAKLDALEREMRDKEKRTLDEIAACESRGGLKRELGDRLVVCEMERKIDNADLYLYLSRGERRPVVQALIYPGSEGLKVKLRSHGGFDLNPLFRRLNELMPRGCFGGRASAGGSNSLEELDREQLIGAVRSVLPA